MKGWRIMNLEELEKQVILLEDIQEIEHLQKIYGYYFDTHNWAKIIDLFSENTESVEVADHGIMYGKKGVKKLYWDVIAGGGSNKFPPWVEFIITQIGGVVTVNPDGKTAQARFQTWLCESKQYGAYPRQEWLHGYYENKYVKENGRWLFSKLHWNNTFCSPFDSGWINTPLMGWMPVPDVDGPPTAFHPYPSGYKVPYTFPHPITGEK
jgi:hypothetical protein